MKGLLALPVLFLLSAVLPALAERQNKADTVTDSELGAKHWYLLTFENDLFVFSDDGFTNGLAFAWGYGPYSSLDVLPSPRWLKQFNSALGLYHKSDLKLATGYAVAQGMYTPDDIEDPELIEDDRPYAGSLLWKSQSRAYGKTRSNSRGLVLGIVGPAAMAEQAQTFIHDITNGTKPMGWDNQIANEAVFRVDAEHIRRLFATQSTGLNADIISYSLAGLGNLRSDVGTGLVFRLGDALGSNYAYVDPDPARGATAATEHLGKDFDWQLQFALYARYVFNDITLDGNTFRDSHSVDLINEQALLSAGVSINKGRWGLLFSMLKGTDSFEQQKTDTAWGAVSISYHH
ncbi:lipid A deacylase LpxR family protein [Agaribacterium haliotis]|uniref:lipid A deacylase LpxR family protein n=1 Tax=Agaribacterium haliotis TaxID=2013869 RepID=UPI0011774C59|nr:lipid A deacylase LpxR family protein [Agaribacterium haliotis]